MKLLEPCEQIFGKLAARLCLVLIAAGAVAALAGLALGRANVVFATAAVDYLYFGGLAAGGVAASAMFVVSKGKWALELQPAAEAAGTFFPGSFVLLLVAMGTASVWTPWGAHTSGAWIAFMTLRDAALLGLLYAAGRRFRTHAHAGFLATARALVYLLGYVVIESVVVFDVVMRNYDGEQSTVEPALYFMGALLSGLACATWIEMSWNTPVAPDADGRHDAGKMLFAMSTFWAYLVWSAYLPTWYANIPDETALLLARWEGGYRYLTMATLFATVLFPFFVLIPEASKRARRVLRVAAFSIVAGLFGANTLMVLPDVGADLSPANAAILLLISGGVGGIFVLAYASALLRYPGRAAKMAAAGTQPAPAH
ncbi:MAG TPA: hypothetical protein VMV18_02335 [bacterium]|nr:hypothetical protein [bacterium]